MRRIHALATLVVLLTAAPALAQEAGGEVEPPPEYQELIDRAVAELGASRYAESRALFRRAHETFPNARTLRGIAMVDFELREYATCIRNARRALADERRPLTDGQRTQLGELVTQASSFVARYDLSELPPDAQLVVDGQARGREADGSLMLTLGQHQVAVSAGELRDEVELTVRGGEAGPLPVHLREPLGEPTTEPEAHGAPAQPAPPVRVEPASTGLGPGPFLTTLGGVVLALAGGSLVLVGALDYSTVENATPGTPWTELRAAYERGPALLGAGVASLVVGIGLTAGGAAWVVAEGETEPRAILVPLLGPTIAGAQVRGRW